VLRCNRQNGHSVVSGSVILLLFLTRIERAAPGIFLFPWFLFPNYFNIHREDTASAFTKTIIMASTTPLMSPRLDGFHFQHWSFQKATLEAQKEMAVEHQLQSEPPSPDMFSTNSATEDQIHIQSPDLKSIQSPNLRSGVTERKARSRLVDRYISSEEHLSPMESADSLSSPADMDYIADDEDDLLDEKEDNKMDWLEHIFGEFTCKMATAICFIQAGKPRVVNIPVPSLTSSPSLSSESDKMESNSPLTSSVEDNIHSYSPPRPKTPVRRRPVGHGFGITMGSPESPTKARMMASTTTMSTPKITIVQTYQPTSPERKPIQKSAPRQIFNKPTTVATYMPKAPKFLTIDPFAKTAVPKPPTPLVSSHSERHNITPASAPAPVAPPAPVLAPPPPPTQSQGHSRIRNLSQKLHIFGKNSSKVDLLDERPKTRDSVEFFGHHKSKSSISEPFTKPRSMSVSVVPLRPMTAGASKPKMIPRGAAERAPVIEIPPCPAGLDLNFDGPVSASQGLPKAMRGRKGSILKT
jgi:hypothetical protein